MPGGNPTPQDLHVDPLLTEILIAYMNLPSAFIADGIFPTVNVRKQSAKIAQWTKADWFRDLAEIRAPGTESTGSGFGSDTSQSYFADNFATHVNVDDETRDNQDVPFDVDSAATQIISDRIRLRREKAFATDFFKTGVWDTDVVGGTDFTEWDDYANSDIIGDIETGKEKVHSTTGREPGDLTIGREVWTKIKHHPDFLERIKYTQRAILTVELVASLLELNRLMIGRAINVTSAEGQTAVFAYVFGKNALLTFAPARAQLMVPSAGYTFVWTRRGGIGFTRRIRDDKAQYDRLEGHSYFDQKTLGVDLGYFFSGAVT